MPLTMDAVAVALAKATSSLALNVTPAQADSWLYGGVPNPQEVDAYLDAVARHHGYDPSAYTKESYDRYIYRIMRIAEM